MSERIFTFWEPKSNMPGYLDLSMRTWEKFLPGYEVVVCDYSNLGDYLDKKTISEILCKEMPVHMQSDCVRAALVKTHGGMWLDADTIITSAECFEWMTKSEVVMIGQPSKGRIHGGFIYAAKPEADFINAWYSALPSRVRNYRLFCRFKFLRRIFKKKWREMERWDYCVNAIIDPISRSFSEDQFILVDRNSIGALPEFLSMEHGKNISPQLATPAAPARHLRQLFQDFYLKKGNAKAQVLDKTKGIVLLHNSRVPKHYRDMDADEFLRQDILLSDLLKTILK